jgi:hypothetical protein
MADKGFKHQVSSHQKIQFIANWTEKRIDYGQPGSLLTPMRNNSKYRWNLYIMLIRKSNG